MSEAAQAIAAPEGEQPPRRVRGSIAFLLTMIFGWGMGHFYARRTKTAMWLIGVQMLLLVPMIGFFIVLAFVDAPWIWAIMRAIPVTEQGPTVALQFAGWLIAAPIAIWAWIDAARRPRVARAGPLRLLGYVGIWLIPAILAGGAAIWVRMNIVQPFRLPSGSMMPTIHQGEYFSARPPARQGGAPIVADGDVVVFRPTREPNRDFVKRVLAVGGQRIAFHDGVPIVDGVAAHQAPAPGVNADHAGWRVMRETLGGRSYLVEYAEEGDAALREHSEIVVPEGQMFVVGDSRDNSADSRMWGPEPVTSVRRKAARIIASPDRNRVGKAIE